MKKFISWILTLALIMTAISGISVKAADSVLLNENFDDGESKIVADTALQAEYVDISTITGATGGNTSGKVLKVSKAASEKAGGGKAYIPFPDATGSFTLTYKALIPSGNGSLAIGAVNGDTSDNWFKSGLYSKFVRLNNGTYEEKITTNDNTSDKAVVNSIAYNKWYDVKAVIDVKNKTYTITIDGTTKSYKLRTTTAFDSINSFYIWFVSDTKARTVYIDDVKVTEKTTVTPGIFNHLLSDNEPMVSEDFEGFTPGSAYTSSKWNLSNSFTDMEVVTDATQGNVLKVKSGKNADGYTYCKFQYVPSAPISNSILINFDMKAIKGSKTIGIYANGTTTTELSGASGNNCVTSQFGFSKNSGEIKNTRDLTDYNAGAVDYQHETQDIYTQAEYNKWVNIKVVLDPTEKKVHFYYENEYVGSSDFRKTDVRDIKLIYLGFDGRNSYSEDLYIDNISFTDLGSTSSILYNAKDIHSWDFSSEAQLNDFAVSKTEGTVSVSDGAMKMSCTSNQNKEAKEYKVTLSEKPNTVAGISFKYKIEGSGQLNMHLQPGPVQSMHIRSSQVSIYKEKSTTEIISKSDVNAGIGTGSGWHTLKLYPDFLNQKCTVALDGYIIPGTIPFRSSGAEIENLVFSVYGNNTSETSVYIDDLHIIKDITYYPTPSFTSDLCSIDNEAKTISIAESATVAVSGIASLIGNGDDYTISVSDNDENGFVTNGDNVVFKSESDAVSFIYDVIVKGDIDVSVESLLVTGTDGGDDDFAAAKRITKAGAAEVNVRIRNNTTGSLTPFAAVAVYDDNGRSVAIDAISNITINENEFEDYKFNVAIPSGVDAGSLKIIVWKSADDITPVLKYPIEYSVETNEFTMDNCFSNNMVLQRGTPINIFGSAPEGAKVTATLGENNTASVYVPKGSNEFLIKLSEEEASAEGKTLTVAAELEGKSFEPVTVSDVHIGDVYYGAGQSNMQYTSNLLMTNSTLTQAVYDAEVGDLENAWCFTVQNNSSVAKRVDDPSSVTETWRDLSVKNNAMGSSATMINTIKQIRNLTGNSDVPIGVIVCAKGATTINKWVNKETICESPAFSGTAEENDYINNVADKYDVEPTNLYYAMARTVMPYTVKAAIWYQGEGDAGKFNRYDLFVDAMIENYRQGFGNSALPYIIIQLPGYVSSDNWSNTQLAQWNAQKLSDNVYTVVTHDSGQENNVHPASKAIVGERVARVLLGKLGGYSTMPWLSPEMESWSASDNGSVTVTIKNINDGIHGSLQANEGIGNAFQIKANDGTWHNATASISGNTITLTSDEVTTKAAGVRYGYGGKIVKGVYSSNNGEKLPLAPFNTDYIGNSK